MTGWVDTPQDEFAGVSEWRASVPGDVGLICVHGSHCYGLATAESDVDYKGFYIAPTVDFLGLDKPAESFTRHDPDVQMHEIGKFIRLALNANPSILEALASPLVLRSTAWGEQVREALPMFITQRARNTYGGFATQQLRKLERGGPTVGRDHKWAKHFFRLLEAGTVLLETGELVLRPADPEGLVERANQPFDALVADMHSALDRFNTVESRLPLEPDYEGANTMLKHIRLTHLEGA